MALPPAPRPVSAILLSTPSVNCSNFGIFTPATLSMLARTCAQTMRHCQAAWLRRTVATDLILAVAVQPSVSAVYAAANCCRYVLHGLLPADCGVQQLLEQFRRMTSGSPLSARAP